MDRDVLERRLRSYEAFAEVSPDGPERDRFEGVVRDLRLQLSAMDDERAVQGEVLAD